jgi:VWFA-related protein
LVAPRPPFWQLKPPKKALLLLRRIATDKERKVGNERRKGLFVSILLLAAASLSVCVLGLTQTRADGSGITIEPRSRSTPGVAGEADRLGPNIRIDANLVLIPVLVTDRNDRLITGLEKEHFKVFEDKVEQVITQFAAEDAPVSIGLLIDCSGSMGPKLARSRAAVAEFLRTANAEDEFLLVTFNDHAELVTSFTNRIEEIQNRMMYMESRGRTALLDAIYLALHEMKNGKHARKALLIISDGGDNSSRYSYRQVRNYIREADVQIYSIGILEPPSTRGRSPEELAGPTLLEEIAQQTGGRLYEVDDLSQLQDIASKIGAALRNEYLLGYTPAEGKHDGKYHKISVKLDPPRGLPSLRATFRSGYYAR